MEDKAQGRRRDHFDKFGGSMSNMRSSAGYMTCASCSEDANERLRVKYPCWTASSCYQYELFVLTDSLIVDNWIPQNNCQLEWHHLPQLRVRRSGLFAHGQTLSYPVNHFGVTVCVVESTVCRCEKQKNQSGMLKQWLMMEDKAQGRRRDHFDKFGVSEQHEIISRIHDMCIMLRRCQRKVKGEVPMLDSFKLLPVWAVLADSLIVDNWIPQNHCQLEWHHLPQLRVRRSGLFAHGQTLSYPVNHFGVTVCVVESIVCRCEKQKNQSGMLKQWLMMEDKAQGRRRDHFDKFGVSEQHEIISRIHDMCIMLRRCQRKVEGEVPMLDSFKLLPVWAVLADSLIVDNWIPQNHCQLEWHHLPQLRVRRSGLFAHGQTLSYPVNHFGVTVCVVESTVCRCEKQKNQSGMLRQWLMMEDKAQGRRRDHFDKFGVSEQHEIISRIPDMCIMLGRCQRKVKGEVPMLDSFKLLQAQAVCLDWWSDSGQLNPTEQLHLAMTSSATVEGKKKCFFCKWPRFVISCQHRLRRLTVKYLCCTASSCCKLSDFADRALFQSCKAAATLQTCACRELWSLSSPWWIAFCHITCRNGSKKCFVQTLRFITFAWTFLNLAIISPSQWKLLCKTWPQGWQFFMVTSGRQESACSSTKSPKMTATVAAAPMILRSAPKCNRTMALYCRWTQQLLVRSPMPWPFSLCLCKRDPQKLNAKVWPQSSYYRTSETMYAHMHEYTRLSAPFTSKEPGISEGWFVNKKSLSMGTSTNLLSGIDFSQLNPNPSLHRWQQRHWCPASKQTAACCRLQDATATIPIYMNTLTD